MKNSQKAFFDYLSLEKKFSAHTITAYVHDLEAFNTFLIANNSGAELENIVYGNVRSWIISLSEDGIGNATINRKITALKCYYKFLLKTEQIALSPLLKHKSLKTAKKLQVPFSPLEMNKVLDDIPYEKDFVGVRDRCIIELFYSSGIRRAELMGLKVSDVSFSSRTLRVLGKGNKERIIPVLPSVIENLSKYLPFRQDVAAVGVTSLFVTERGAKLYESFVYRLIIGYFSTVSEKVKKSPHILRHTFATHLLNNGADINSVKELLGHASLASTQIYTHSSLAELQKVYGAAHPRSNNEN